MPVPVVQMPSGALIVQVPPNTESSQDERKTAVYARVSSHDQKSDLDGQVARVVASMVEQGYTITDVITEIGSGLNGNRPKLLRALNDTTITIIAVEHKDRLARFGFEYIQAAMAAGGRKLVIVNKSEIQSDLVQDFVDITTSLCAKIYGRRSAENRAKRAVAAAAENDE